MKNGVLYPHALSPDVKSLLGFISSFRGRSTGSDSEGFRVLRALGSYILNPGVKGLMVPEMESCEFDELAVISSFSLRSSWWPFLSRKIPKGTIAVGLNGLNPKP